MALLPAALAATLSVTSRTIESAPQAGGAHIQTSNPLRWSMSLVWLFMGKAFLDSISLNWPVKHE